MNDIITRENGVYVVSEALKKQYIKTTVALEELKQYQDELKADLLKAMEENGVYKIESDDMTITYIAPTDREYFNGKKLKSDNPDLYDEYVEIRPVKASLRVKLDV